MWQTASLYLWMVQQHSDLSALKLNPWSCKREPLCLFVKVSWKKRRVINKYLRGPLLDGEDRSLLVEANATRIRNQAPSTVRIPYVPYISEAIRRTLNQEGIRVAFSSTNTSGKPLNHVKHSIPIYNVGQLVYKLSCQDCTAVQIGETSWSVAKKMKEHSRLTKRHPKTNEERKKLERSSALALHILETEHHVDFDNPEILSKNWSLYISYSELMKILHLRWINFDSKTPTETSERMGWGMLFHYFPIRIQN